MAGRTQSCRTHKTSTWNLIKLIKMKDYELIMAIYDRCPDFTNNQATLDQCFDRCQDIREMIERERPELVKSNSEYPQQDVGIDY